MRAGGSPNTDVTEVSSPCAYWQSSRECGYPSCTVRVTVAYVAPNSRTSIVEVVENFSTAPGSWRKTWSGEPIARTTRTTEGDIP
ncbi:hypothetical protein SAMN05661080_03520 [Modestobacter sp. DSM 44400]|nr:hypothetical protein SAMN05661080_03520 [Modestobacter sp. DSM 44400]